MDTPVLVRLSHIQSLDRLGHSSPRASVSHTVTGQTWTLQSSCVFLTYSHWTGLDTAVLTCSPHIQSLDRLGYCSPHVYFSHTVTGQAWILQSSPVFLTYSHWTDLDTPVLTCLPHIQSLDRLGYCSPRVSVSHTVTVQTWILQSSRVFLTYSHWTGLDTAVLTCISHLQSLYRLGYCSPHLSSSLTVTGQTWTLQSSRVFLTYSHWTGFDAEYFHSLLMVTENSLKFSVMMGTLLSVVGSRERHPKPTKDMYMSLKSASSWTERVKVLVFSQQWQGTVRPHHNSFNPSGFSVLISTLSFK